MPNYAIYENDIILNVIIADNKEVAEEATGLNALETEGIPWLNWILVNGEWVSPKPYPSWTLNENNEWVAPKDKPKDDKNYSWDEESLEWIEIP